MRGLVDPGLRHDPVRVCADGGLDVVLACVEDSREGEGGGDIFWADEEGVVVRVGVFGDGVQGKVQAGFVPHGWGFEWSE